MASNNPRISVIVPAYNVENYIEASLDSLFNQETPVYEVIVVNDGSTDSTPEKIARYAHRPEIHVVSTQNNGLGPARNEGMRHATGEYVYFFDSDDLLDKRFLTTIASTVRAQGRPDLILFSGASFQNGNGPHTLSYDLLRPFEMSGLNGNTAVEQLVGAGTPKPNAWLYVSKNHLWHNGRLSFMPIIHEDDAVFLPLVLSARNVVILKDVLVYRRIRPMSIMTSKKTAENAHGLFVAASTLTRLYQCSTDRPVRTRRAIRKRAVRTARRYMRVCRKVGIKAETREMLRFAYIVRSLLLVLISIGCNLAPRSRP